MAEAPTPVQSPPPPVRVHWPNGATTEVAPGTDWLQAARDARVPLPTGCLGGSCGACEISVNGDTLRACVSLVEANPGDVLWVELWDDPSW
jgi:ferredoxin